MTIPDVADRYDDWQHARAGELPCPCPDCDIYCIYCHGIGFVTEAEYDALLEKHDAWRNPDAEFTTEDEIPF
jgi:hypothetical protein